MTIRLALDLSSSSTGYALVEKSDKGVAVLGYGTLKLSRTSIDAYGKYPFCYHTAADEMAESVLALARQHQVTEIVIEETNLGKNRYSQKILEFIHCLVLEKLKLAHECQVLYLSSSAWRKELKLTLTPEQKKANAKLSAAKKKSAESGVKLDKTALGIKGKVTNKHLALFYVRDRFGLEFLAKDDDIADAICLGTASFGPAVVFCDGFQKKGIWS